MIEVSLELLENISNKEKLLEACIDPKLNSDYDGMCSYIGLRLHKHKVCLVFSHYHFFDEYKHYEPIETFEHILEG